MKSFYNIVPMTLILVLVWHLWNITLHFTTRVCGHSASSPFLGGSATGHNKNLFFLSDYIQLTLGDRDGGPGESGKTCHEQYESKSRRGYQFVGTRDNGPWCESPATVVSRISMSRRMWINLFGPHCQVGLSVQGRFVGFWIPNFIKD